MAHVIPFLTQMMGSHHEGFKNMADDAVSFRNKASRPQDYEEARFSLSEEEREEEIDSQKGYSNLQHTYEVITIEVLDERTPRTSNGTDAEQNAPLRTANFLKGTEIRNKSGEKKFVKRVRIYKV